VSTTAATGITDAERSQALLYVIVVSPLFGLATAAFAGFYRRFLRATAPAPQQRKSAAKSQRSAAKPGR
jgi:phosphate/sulfate permease